MPRQHANPPCASPCCPPHRGRHTPGCLETDAKCDGCLPRLAADGLRLCGLCRRLLAEDPGTLAQRYADLEQVLTRSGALAGELVRSSADPNLHLNGAAAVMRSRIRSELVALVRLVAEERGVRLPTVDIGPLSFVDSSVGGLARFVARHAEWLAAHPAADEHAAALRDLVRESWPVAFPSGARLFPVRVDRRVPGARGVAGCPATIRVRVAFAVDRRGRATEVLGPAPCPGSLWSFLSASDRLPSAVLCNADDGHRWETRQWLRVLGPAVVRALAEHQAADSSAAAPPLPPSAAPDPVVVAMRAATRVVVSGAGCTVVCVSCGGVVVEGGWGLLEAAQVSAWQRHECLQGRVA